MNEEELKIRWNTLYPELKDSITGWLDFKKFYLAGWNDHMKEILHPFPEENMNSYKKL